jgi:predicted aspartyl protease
MGSFRYRFEVGNADQTRWERVEAWVDSGAAYTWLPASMLRRLGFAPMFQRSFKLANGQIIQRDLTRVPVRIGDEVQLTLTVFGDENSDPLLGAVTLEEFSLGIDPIHKTLVPIVANALTLIPEEHEDVP